MFGPGFGVQGLSSLTQRLGKGPLGSVRQSPAANKQWGVIGHYSQPHERIIRILGIDFGQMHDPAAAAMIRIRECDSDYIGPRYPFWDVSYMRVWEVGKFTYEEIIDDCFALNPDFYCFDYGGVGRGLILEIRRRAQEISYHGKVIPIQAVSSNANMRMMENPQGRYLIAPKIELVSTLNMLQQKKILRLPKTKETNRLAEEMRDFKMLYTKAAGITFDQRGKQHHGDLIMALGQAVWFAWRPRRELAVNTM